MTHILSWAEQLPQAQPNVLAAIPMNATLPEQLAHRQCAPLRFPPPLHILTSLPYVGLSYAPPIVATLTLCQMSLDFSRLNPYTRCHSAVLAWSLVGVISGLRESFPSRGICVPSWLLRKRM